MKLLCGFPCSVESLASYKALMEGIFVQNSIDIPWANSFTESLSLLSADDVLVIFYSNPSINLPGGDEGKSFKEEVEKLCDVGVRVMVLGDCRHGQADFSDENIKWFLRVGIYHDTFVSAKTAFESMIFRMNLLEQGILPAIIAPAST